MPRAVSNVLPVVRRAPHRNTNRKVRSCVMCPENNHYMEYGKWAVELCCRCHLLKCVVEAGVAAGIFGLSGACHYLDWQPTLPTHISFWSDLKWWIHHDDEYIDDKGLRFELFTSPGQAKPFEDFPVKAISEDTASAQSLADVQGWLQICEAQHTLCRRQSRELPILPRRVLDVASHIVRLFETNNEAGQYICLSHCWGATRPRCTTTTATLRANQAGIAWNDLPLTFQDAIDFTRRLGFRYIWIDSLCIIQDDQDDWREQAGLMATIYENAYVTLCATSSSSDDSGCYMRTPADFQLQKLLIYKMDGQEYEIFLRAKLAERHIPTWYFVANCAATFPLMTRAWAYQERLLSPRLVHFTMGEVMWECSELSTCECLQTSEPIQSPFAEYSKEKSAHTEVLAASDPEKLRKHWYVVVKAYSGLSLTREEDKLPALSGVVKQMLRLRPDDEYLAGMWKGSILSDLRWGRVGDNSYRPRRWRSPSWSWASLNGVVEHVAYDEQPCDYCTCVDIGVTPAGTDATGEVLSGYVVLCGPGTVVEVEESLDYDDRELYRFYFLIEGYQIWFRLDCKDDFHKEFEVGDKLLCLRLGNMLYNNHFSLVLKPVGEDRTYQIYKRLGYMQNWNDQYKFTRATATEDMVTVKII